MIRNSDQIPLLDGTYYRDHYFNHAPANGADTLATHFEIHNRCILRDSVPAHRVDFYMIFLVTSGDGVHMLGDKSYTVTKNMLCFVGPNVINAWKTEGENRGFFCAFSDEFFNSGRSGKSCLSGLPFFQIDGTAALYLTDEEATQYLSLFRMMEDEFKNRTEFSSEILRGYLQVLIGKSKASLQQADVDDHHTSRAGVRLVKAFTDLYMADVNTVRTGKGIRLKRVADYADALGVSQNHLNDTIKSITGHSAGQLMKSQLVKQATMCLKHSTKTIAEIGYLLGFDDPSYFARFYKKQTGKLPSDFR